MQLNIKASNGKSLVDEFKSILMKSRDTLVTRGSKQMGNYVVKLIKNYLQHRFPNSKHYDPEKVKYTTFNNGGISYSSIEIDIPGISRAYHDIDIYPIKGKYLTIPMNRKAYGLSPTKVDGLFGIKGKKALFKTDGNMLVAMYALATHVHQKKDPTIMPSDQDMLEAMEKSILDIDI